MIACPLCGLETAVIETRRTGGAARRRRKCTDPSCAGRVTTVEVVVDRFHGATELANGRSIIVSRRALAKLQRAVAALGGTS
jgi:transcriptional regulator NrdR family protein